MTNLSPLFCVLLPDITLFKSLSFDVGNKLTGLCVLLVKKKHKILLNLLSGYGFLLHSNQIAFYLLKISIL